MSTHNDAMADALIEEVKQLRDLVFTICSERDQLQADLAAANEKLRAFEHYVMTGRNEQHDRLVADLEAARELPTAMANGYTAGSVTEHEFHSVHLHYNTRQQAVAAFEAISDAIDAAIAGEKK